MHKAPHKIIASGIRELLSLAHRLGEKMKDRYIWTHMEMEQAIGYLIYFRDYLKKQKGKRVTFVQIFGESGEFFEIRHFKRGFNSKSITFKTIVDNEVRKWVLKIGHRISPVVDFGDPSTEVYSKEYEKHLDLLREKIGKVKYLAQLLPEPEEVVWAVLTEEGQQTATTLIVQPFMHIAKPKKIKKKLTPEQRERLLEEFNAFKSLCTDFEKKYKLQPDLMGEGNLEIVEKNGEYHLMLLDAGLVNLDAPLPFTQAFMYFAGVQTMANVENLIKKIL